MMFRSVLAVVLILGTLVPSLSMYAQEFSSSFQARDAMIGTFGGGATSTSFSSVQSGTQDVTGEATSTNFTLLMGPMYFNASAPKSRNWRWYGDETNLTPQTPLAAENVAPTNIAENDGIKLRISVAETAGIGAADVKLRLQYSTSSNFSTGAYDLTESWQCNGSSQWCYANGAGIDGALIASSTLSDADSCVSSVGAGCGVHTESGTSTTAFDHGANAVSEFEFTIQSAGANINTVYFFRVFDATSSTTVETDTGESYPSLVTGGSSLEFSITGVGTGINTEGTITDVTTTATSIPFGTLGLNAPKVGAQRLSVSTNGTGGYKVYAYERQQLLANTGAAIDPFAGTNESPTSWGTGCTGGVTGCYGYHSGEDVLEGGSTRFAPNDTFAQFTNEPREIAYNSGPAVAKETDILYQVEARNLQEAGEYSSDIVFIVTPVF